jgi:hypothetical protein
MEEGLSDHQYACLCDSTITFEPTGRFHEDQEAGHPIEGNIDTIVFKPVASILLKCQNFKFLM